MKYGEKKQKKNNNTFEKHVCVNDCHLFEDVPKSEYGLKSKEPDVQQKQRPEKVSLIIFYASLK